MWENFNSKSFIKLAEFAVSLCKSSGCIFILPGRNRGEFKKIFDYVHNGEWVVLLDEFDAIAKDRNSPNEHGEIQRLVNSLLQLIDQSNEQSIFIAATNHQSLLDPAIWRRFDEVLFLINLILN